MHRNWTRMWIIGLASGLAGAGLASTALASEEGQAAVAQITDASFRAILGDDQGVPGILYTHVGDNRGVNGPEHDLCRANIQDQMLAYGLSVTLEPFTYYGNTYYNVVGTKLGTVHPNQEYIIGAHFDSVDNPGADDNASGVTAVLEAARVICQYDSEYTIRFIAFDREEQGLYGSTAYVAAHLSDDILGMFSADMIAYDTGSNAARIYSRSFSAPLMNAMGAAITEYGGGVTWTDAGWIGASDHAPFSDAGFQAALIIEYDVWDNPYYHQLSDNVENPQNINYPYAVNMTRAIVGWLVDSANVLVSIDELDFAYPSGQSELIAPAGGTTMMVEVVGVGTEVPQPGTGMLHYNAGYGWEVVPMTETTPNLYEAAFPSAFCGSEVDYYFSAESQTGEVYTAPKSAPGVTFTALAGYGHVAFYSETLDTNPGWFKNGSWGFGQPTGGGGAYGYPDPTAGHTGLNVYGFNLAGDYANNSPEWHVTTAPIDCTGQYGVRLRFWRYLNVEANDADHAYIRVSTNGYTWYDAWENPDTDITDSDWTQVECDISAYADNDDAVRVRWTMGTTNPTARYSGWNVDDIELTSLSCTPPVAPTGDYDGDGDVDLADATAFMNCFSDAGQLYPGGAGCEAFDFDFDVDVDLADFATFHSVLVGP